MSNFDFAIDFVFAVEGYLSNHKADAGGLTKYGIAQKSHPHVDVRNLTMEGAKKIYRADYWDACKCDEYERDVALYVMDFAVNTGVGTARKALQKCVNALRSGKTPLVVDGKIGPKTLEAVKEVDARALVGALHAYRTNYFFGITARNPSQNVFLRGWMNRMAKLCMYVNGIGIKQFGSFV